MKYKVILTVVLGVLIAAGGLVSLALWFALLYSLLTFVHAPSGIWILYWIYVPVAVIVQILVGAVQQLVKSLEKDLKCLNPS